MAYYTNGKLMITAVWYKDGKSIITSLIIIKIRFVYFKKDNVGRLCIRLYGRSRFRSNNYRSCNHSLTKSI